MITEIKKEVEIDSKQSCRVVASVLPSSPRPGATTPWSVGRGGGFLCCQVRCQLHEAALAWATTGYKSGRHPRNANVLPKMKTHFAYIFATFERERETKTARGRARESACKCRGTGLTWLKIYSFFLFISFFFGSERRILHST